MPFLKLEEVRMHESCAWIAVGPLGHYCVSCPTMSQPVTYWSPRHSQTKILQLEDKVFCRLGFLFQERSDEFWLALRSDCELVLPYARLALFAAKSSSVSSSLQRRDIFCTLCFVFCILYFAVRRCFSFFILQWEVFSILHFVFCSETCFHIWNFVFCIEDVFSYFAF